MIIIRSYHLRAIFLSAALFASFGAALNAADVLFKDSFQFAESNKGLADMKDEHQGRQSGVLAPAAYSSNGEGWQCKSNVGSSYNGGLRLFPSGNRIPLVVSPAWELAGAAGEYSLILQIRPRSWTGSEEPEKILIALGAAKISGMAGVPPNLAGAVVIELNMDQANQGRFLRVFFDEAEAASRVELSNMADLAQYYNVTIRWKQTGARRLEGLSVEIDGAKVFDLPDAGFVLKGAAVLFGGQVGPGQNPRNQFADMSVGGLQYIKEHSAKPGAAESLAQPNRPLIGAIRWDGWGNNCAVGKDSERVFGPAKYHHRAPFFVASSGEDFIEFEPLSQEIMDREIAYALHAGIDYWAFDWYPPGKGMELARDLFLASTKRDGLKWCVVLGTYYFDMERDAPWLAAEFAKPGYQKVLDGRPLVYLFTPIRRSDLDTLRELSLKSCGKTPYVAMMGWTAKKTAELCEAMGADAVSMYAGGTEQNWNDYSKLKELIPNVSTGWDPSPFKDTYVSWYPAENVGQEFVAWSVTPKELITSLETAFAWTRANSEKVPANTILIYAWNEHSEGGWLCPTYTPQGPNTERIDAMHEWISRQGSVPEN